MATGTSVFLYGDSLLLAGIKAQLEGCQEFELIPALAGCNRLPRPAAGDAPHILLFDMAVTAPDLAVAFLREDPDLVAIGVDPARDKMIILTCQSKVALCVADLVDVIKQSTASRGAAGG